MDKGVVHLLRLITLLYYLLTTMFGTNVFIQATFRVRWVFKALNES